MVSEELVIAVMREVEREAAKSRRSEKALEQAVRPRSGQFARSIRYLPLPSFKTASAS
ncbi:MAG: hypothetical protein IIC91_15330 [Chloroflexi bacterium]|nr:hypothetical protein [Chloroflexota bacterium]MCH8010223.1 hypothetical protein [Chloroflexota bacterium]